MSFKQNYEVMLRNRLESNGNVILSMVLLLLLFSRGQLFRRSDILPIGKWKYFRFAVRKIRSNERCTFLRKNCFSKKSRNLIKSIWLKIDEFRVFSSGHSGILKKFVIDLPWNDFCIYEYTVSDAVVRICEIVFFGPSRHLDYSHSLWLERVIYLLLQM